MMAVINVGRKLNRVSNALLVIELLSQRLFIVSLQVHLLHAKLAHLHSQLSGIVLQSASLAHHLFELTP